MKISIILLGLWMSLAAVRGQSSFTNSYSISPYIDIPQGNLVGVSEQFVVSGMSGVLGGLTLSLNIAGGFNGNLYSYLVGPQGQMAILLNSVGVTSGNPFGASDAGFNIVLDMLATNNVHDYASSAYSLNPDGQVTGTWAADGRNIDPLSDPAAFDSAATTSGLNIFQGMEANGTWTLFLAEAGSGGVQPVLQSAILTVTTIPEPAIMALFGLGISCLLLARRRKQF